MGNVYFTADRHWYHANIIRHAGRPFRSLGEMHEELIRRHNAVVGPEDTVYELGDVTLASDAQAHNLVALRARMNGQSWILVPGNHDDLPLHRYLRMGYDEICTRMEISLMGHRVTLVHDPAAAAYGWNGAIRGHSDRPRDRAFRDTLGEYLSWFRQEGKIVFCGHWHEKFLKLGPCVNVGVDAWNYYPVPGEKLLALALSGFEVLSAEPVGGMEPNWLAPHLRNGFGREPVGSVTEPVDP